tara:strand:+ start:277 stop:507 length:231 start_codon:yes stop_codon:yes gene_type:complete
MSGANLDGYNTPRNGIHFKELQRKVVNLETEYEKIKEVITYLVNENFKTSVLPKEWEKLNEGKEKSIGDTGLSRST